MRYALARYQNDSREQAYRIFVTDTLRIVAKNGGSYPEGRYADLLRSPIGNDRLGEEIVADVVKCAGLEVVK